MYVILKNLKMKYLPTNLVKNADEYLLKGSLNRKFIVELRPFLSVKTSDMSDYIKPKKKGFNPDMCPSRWNK